MQALKRTYLIDIGNSALKWAEATTPQNTGVITYGDMVMLAEQVRDFYRHQRLNSGSQCHCQYGSAGVRADKD